MHTQSNLITTIENYQTSIISGLNEITTDNFDEDFQKVFLKAKTLNSLYESKEFNSLLHQNKEFVKITSLRAKLIRESFDNVVERFRKESKELEEQLNTTTNKKKIANYLRAPL